MIRNIAVVGGGTAGWLVANHLGQAFRHLPDYQITLIESPSIATIGVGEGTVPAIRYSLKKFGVSETDLFNQCDATFKHSIHFINWLDRNKHGDNGYHHLFSNPLLRGLDLTSLWLQQGGDYASFVSPQATVVAAKLAPKLITTAEYQCTVPYAYHFDARKFAGLLHTNATRSFQVKYLQADVTDIRTDEAGFITHLMTAQHGALAFDFVVDCTGFQASLLGEKLKIPFQSCADQLFTDTALAVQVPYSQEPQLPPYTLASAHQAGWIWDIALTSRRGVGFVYSSAHMAEEKAYQKLERYVGKSELAALSVRKIPMRVGRRAKFWHKNCVAIGLSQGFVEPLEATAILLADFSADLLSQCFPADRDEMNLVAERFNQRMVHAWDRVLDFIKLHYCISDRTDSDFWHDNREPASIPESLQQKLALWRNHVPTREDFFSKFEVFDLENYLYVLYGMRYPTKKPLLRSDYQAQAELAAKQVQQQAMALTAELGLHMDLLAKIKQYGLQRL
ncbi:tryptophan halogenase family protein [Alkalimonas amylolytica]|uniref:Tryptophan halogenase n=1 Tax=Alkalimonas amylolytica TaxID=152573 RepID=A0A1H3Y9X7_ALKAM|nr:tryptophan halogenase family protein [Alkalimonas amylolytica]SEA07702.1 tryptophan halogenase [Alkalimonas amylolytica]